MQCARAFGQRCLRRQERHSQSVASGAFTWTRLCFRGAARRLSRVDSMRCAKEHADCSTRREDQRWLTTERGVEPYWVCNNDCRARVPRRQEVHWRELVHASVQQAQQEQRCARSHRSACCILLHCCRWRIARTGSHRKTANVRLQSMVSSCALAVGDAAAAWSESRSLLLLLWRCGGALRDSADLGSTLLNVILVHARISTCTLYGSAQRSILDSGEQEVLVFKLANCM